MHRAVPERSGAECDAKEVCVHSRYQKGQVGKRASPTGGAREYGAMSQPS